MTTKPEAQDCVGCHRTHQEIGGGACAACHRPGDASYGVETVSRTRPSETGFGHFTSGHRGATEAGRCDECHTGAAAVSAAETVSTTPIPDESAPACRDCHVRRRARFHWR